MPYKAISQAELQVCACSMCKGTLVVSGRDEEECSADRRKQQRASNLQLMLLQRGQAFVRDRAPHYSSCF